MSKHDNSELVSALMDGALDQLRVEIALKRLKGDADLRRQWGQYHLIGDALRGEMANERGRELADAVRRRLAAEPTLLAPPKPLTQPRWKLPLWGGALAASVLLATISWVVFMDQQEITGELPGTVGSADLLADGKDDHAAMRDRYRQGIYLQPEQQERLKRYLLNHQHLAPESDVNGMLPFATAVSYTSR